MAEEKVRERRGQQTKAPGRNHLPVVPNSARLTPEMRWLTANAATLEKHNGEWLLISGSTLVAHSADIREIRRAIDERGLRSPFVYYVPTEEESDFIAI